MVLIRLIRPRLRPHGRPLAVLALTQVVQTTAALCLPTLNAVILDDGVVRGETAVIVRLGAVMLAVSAVQLLCAVAGVRLGAGISAAVGRDVRAELFDRVQAFSGREVARFGAASLITRLIGDVQQVQTVVLTGLTQMVAAPVTCAGGIVLALGQDVPLALLLLVELPVLALLVGLVVWRAQSLFRTMQGRVDTMNRVLREQIAGVRVIRAFVRDEHEQRRFGHTNEELTDTAVRSGRLTTLLFPMVNTVVNLAAVPVVWLGAHRVDAGALRIGVLTAFLSYLLQILMSVMMATSVFMALPRAEVCAERIEDVLRAVPGVRAPAVPRPRPRGPARLELRGVGFSYPGAGQPVLSGVDLLVRPGETTAVIGSTGSGKSTLVGLAARLFDPTEGEVLLDGVSVADLDPAALAAAVGLVPQRSYLFSGTIASNLRYGRPDATDEQLWAALETARAHDFVTALAGGLDAPIDQGGGNLSGGQRQRLAIARALVHDPGVYLLDDAFSALDHATEAAVRAGLGRATAGAAVLVVAQRVSTIQGADRIVVLDEGRVVGSGTHDDLLVGNPTYREIVLSQSAGLTGRPTGGVA